MHGSVPALTDVWDFLVGFKAATEAGFVRVEARLDRLEADVAQLKVDVALLQADVYRIERRITRIDDRLSVIEAVHVGVRLDDHERRITRLEQHPA